MSSICPVCGLIYTKPYVAMSPSLNNETFRGTPVCPCCSFDLSYADYNQIFRITNARDNWRCFGYREKKWIDESQKPENWNPIEQIKQIPEKYDREHALKLFRISEEEPKDNFNIV